jgi:hypothetical protein
LVEHPVPPVSITGSVRAGKEIRRGGAGQPQAVHLNWAARRRSWCSDADPAKAEGIAEYYFNGQTARRPGAGLDGCDDFVRPGRAGQGAAVVARTATTPTSARSATRPADRVSGFINGSRPRRSSPAATGYRASNTAVDELQQHDEIIRTRCSARSSPCSSSAEDEALTWALANYRLA